MPKLPPYILRTAYTFNKTTGLHPLTKRKPVVLYQIYSLKAERTKSSYTFLTGTGQRLHSIRFSFWSYQALHTTPHDQALLHSLQPPLFYQLFQESASDGL